MVCAGVCASSMVCAGGVCQLCAAARSRRLLIKQAVLPPNPDRTTRARCCRLVLGAYLANFSGFFFALFFFSRPLLLDTPKADKAMRLGVLESGYRWAAQLSERVGSPSTLSWGASKTVVPRSSAGGGQARAEQRAARSGQGAGKDLPGKRAPAHNKLGIRRDDSA